MILKRSSIAWTDFSGGALNFVIRGATPGECECSPECDNCYALAILLQSGSSRPRTTIYPNKLQALRTATFPEGETPFRRGAASRPLAFVCDMGDLFHPAVPDSFIQEAFTVMRERTDVDWQILTKRPDRILEAIEDPIPSNVWLGVTVGCQESLWRLGVLLDIPASILFVSVEPGLEALDLRRYLHELFCTNHCDWRGSYEDTELDGDEIVCPKCHADALMDPEQEYRLDWVICGGESGPRRRHFEPAWACDLRAQCQDARVPFFYKQGSALRPGQDCLLDGREWKEFPNR